MTQEQIRQKISNKVRRYENSGYTLNQVVTEIFEVCKEYFQSPEPSPPQRTAEDVKSPKEVLEDELATNPNALSYYTLHDSYPTTVTHILRAIESYASQFYTPAHVKQMVGAAWDACEKWLDLGGLAPFPDRETYINSLNLKG